jgi:hypothetical protein
MAACGQCSLGVGPSRIGSTCLRPSAASGAPSWTKTPASPLLAGSCAGRDDPSARLAAVLVMFFGQRLSRPTNFGRRRPRGRRRAGHRGPVDHTGSAARAPRGACPARGATKRAMADRGGCFPAARESGPCPRNGSANASPEPVYRLSWKPATAHSRHSRCSYPGTARGPDRPLIVRSGDRVESDRREPGHLPGLVHSMTTPAVTSRRRHLIWTLTPVVIIITTC